MRKILLLSLLLCYALPAQDFLPEDSTKDLAFSQPTLLDGQQKSKCSIFGSIIDESTKEPIGKAKIIVLGTKVSAISTSDGRFTLTADEDGYYQLKAEAEGYEPQIMNNVYFKNGEPAGFFKMRKLNQPPPDFVEVEKQPKPIEGTTAWPKYPEQARKEGMEGTVWVKVWIDEKGNAREAHVTKSDAEIFNRATIDAALQWKFEPAILKGKPVAVWVTIPFKFKLDPDSIPAEKLDKQPDPKKTVTPKYPESARKLNLTGKFFLKVTIDEKGNVLNTAVDRYDITDHNESTVQHLSQEEKKKRSDEVNSSIEEMKDQAQQAIKQWKFSPGMKDGKAVKVKVTIPVNYSLNDTKGEKKK